MNRPWKEDALNQERSEQGNRKIVPDGKHSTRVAKIIKEKTLSTYLDGEEKYIGEDDNHAY